MALTASTGASIVMVEVLKSLMGTGYR
jgi:hypothetical protein